MTAVEALRPQPGPPAVRGHHWLLDLADCRCDPLLLATREPLEALCVQACESAGMRVVGRAFHQFEPQGVTGVVLLAESHMSVHTWPDERFAAVDVYVCNHERENTHRGAALAQALRAAFQAGSGEVRDLSRSSVGGALGSVAGSTVRGGVLAAA